MVNIVKFAQFYCIYLLQADRDRLLLRQDNADQRLTRRGWEIGLVSSQRLAEVEQKLGAGTVE